MYGLNTVDIYSSALAFVLYQSKENLWTFLHKIPINVFYLEESIKRVKLQRLLFNFYVYMLEMLTDNFSVIKKFAIYQYMYTTTQSL